MNTKEHAADSNITDNFLSKKREEEWGVKEKERKTKKKSRNEERLLAHLFVELSV